MADELFVYQLKATGTRRGTGIGGIIRSKKLYLTEEIALNNSKAFLDLATGSGSYDLDNLTVDLEVVKLEIENPDFKEESNARAG